MKSAISTSLLQSVNDLNETLRRNVVACIRWDDFTRFNSKDKPIETIQIQMKWYNWWMDYGKIKFPVAWATQCRAEHAVLKYFIREGVNCADKAAAAAAYFDSFDDHDTTFGTADPGAEEDLDDEEGSVMVTKKENLRL